MTDQAPYSFLWKLITQPACPTARKQLEECIHQFGLIKNACGLRVVPPRLAVILPSEHGRDLRGPKAPRLSPRDWRELQYDFEELSNANVLKSSPEEGVTFREEFKLDLHRQLYVYCAQESHPCFEAMYDAKFPSDGTRVKVLLQVKIHDNLQAAIEGRDGRAALGRSWLG